MSDRVDIEVLLEHRDFVRGLARSLVRDDARADDLVQDTFVTALENPPHHAGALRAWLATVVKKLAWTHRRSEQRRKRRERASTPPPELPSPWEVLERANWHQRLVNLVMDLDEPYRATLLLRYFEGLNSSEIAAMHDVPAATVRTRLRRGLEQIRARLDERHGRHAWLGGLALLAGLEPTPVPAPMTSGAAPSLKWLLAGAAAGLFAIAIPLLVSTRSGSGEPKERTTPDRRPRTMPEDAPSLDERAFTVTVLAGGRPAANARVWLQRLARPSWRYTARDAWTTWREGRTGTAGRASWLGAPDGFLRVLAHQPGWARGVKVVHLPLELDYPIVVELPTERIFEAEVVDQSGRPVGGARCEPRDARGEPWLPDVESTDARGRAVLSGIADARDVTVSVTAPGYAAATLSLLPDRALQRVALARLDRTARWPVAGASPASVVLRRIHEPDGWAATVEDDRVVARGLPRGRLPELLAIAPDGSFARVLDGPLRFAAPPVLEVDCGAPGIHVRLFNREGVAVFPDGRTGDGGRVRLPVYADDVLDVRVRAYAREPFESVGRFDPRGGSARVVRPRPAKRPVALRVEPGLPDAFDLLVGPTRLVPHEYAVDGSVLRFEADDTIHLLAAGYLPATAGPGEESVTLEEACAVEIDVVRASARQPFRLVLDGREDLRRGPWRLRLYPGPDGVVREAMLPEGRYRVRDLVSGRTTEEFVARVGETARLRLDLAGAWPPRDPEVRGVVDGPATDVVAGEVVVPVARDGTFRLPWTFDAAVEMYARRPGVDGAPVTLTGPRTGLVLELAPRNVAVLRLEPRPAPPRRGETAPGVFVDGGRLDAVLEGDTLSFFGFEPGERTILVDVAGHAPSGRRLALRAGRNELGAIELDRGHTVRVRVLVRDGEEVPALTIAAQSLAAVRYQRSVRTGGEERAALGGLGSGPFRVTAWDRVAGVPVWSTRMSIEDDVGVTIDLR